MNLFLKIQDWDMQINYRLNKFDEKALLSTRSAIREWKPTILYVCPIHSS